MGKTAAFILLFVSFGLRAASLELSMGQVSLSFGNMVLLPAEDAIFLDAGILRYGRLDAGSFLSFRDDPHENEVSLVVSASSDRNGKKSGTVLDLGRLALAFSFEDGFLLAASGGLPGFEAVAAIEYERGDSGGYLAPWHAKVDHATATLGMRAEAGKGKSLSFFFSYSPQLSWAGFVAVGIVASPFSLSVRYGSFVGTSDDGLLSYEAEVEEAGCAISFSAVYGSRSFQPGRFRSKKSLLELSFDLGALEVSKKTSASLSRAGRRHCSSVWTFDFGAFEFSVDSAFGFLMSMEPVEGFRVGVGEGGPYVEFAFSSARIRRYSSGQTDVSVSIEFP